MWQSRPRCQGPSPRWAGALSLVGTILLIAGCDPDVSSSASRKMPPAGGEGGGAAGLRRDGQPAAKPQPVAKANSGIEGDRMQVFAPVVMTKQTESSPFRFAEIAQPAGID